MSVASILIDVVAEKTGYPLDVLDLDMALDADLGIDSIKRVEILSALQDRLPELPALKQQELGSFRSLRAIVEHVSHDPVAVCVARGTTGVGPAISFTDRIARTLAETVAEKTGYSVEALDLDLRLDVDLGIDSIKRVEIFSAIQDRLPESPPIAPDGIGKLRTLREVVDFLAMPRCQPAEPPRTTSGANPRRLSVASN
jgi:acyl carrier protein